MCQTCRICIGIVKHCGYTFGHLWIFDKKLTIHFWHVTIFGYVLAHFLPPLQKSPGLMTLLNVATAVLGRETRETRVTNSDQLWPVTLGTAVTSTIGRRTGYERPRYDFVAGMCWICRFLSWWKNLEQTWNRGTFRFSRPVFLLLPPCHLPRSRAEVYMPWAKLASSPCYDSSCGFFTNAAVGAIFFVKTSSFRARHLWTLKIHEAVTLILASYKMSANWVTWRLEGTPKCQCAYKKPDKRSHGAILCATMCCYVLL